MILPFLLACGGSDEPPDRRSSEQATGKRTALPDCELITADEQRVGSASSGRTAAAPTTAGVETSPETDREALEALHNATGGPNWNCHNNWLSDVPIGEWFGVTTDDNGHVTRLDLEENQLKGEIPPELGNLARLEWLDLSENQLKGEIPPELGNLARLEWLDLSENQLKGEIPPELGNLTNLRILDLSENQLKGEIPPELGQPSQPGKPDPRWEPVGRGDTPGVGQPHQP